MSTVRDGKPRGRVDQLARAVYNCGPVPPTNPSGPGSRPVSLWATPSVPNGGRTSSTTNYRKDGSKQQIDLGAQVKAWPTPYGFMGDAGNPRYGGGGEFAKFVKAHTQWATPRQEDGESSGMRHSRNVADTLTAQTRLWPTAQVHDSQGNRGNTMDDHHHFPHDLHNAVMSPEQWPTPRTPSGGAETMERKHELGRTTSGGGDLASAAQGKLNPRWVETLMGVPIGWCLPSCACPLIPVSMS